MTTITELTIARPPQNETTVTVVGLRLTNPHATNIITDHITPPSGTLTIDGDVLVDGSVTCDPLYVDDINAKTPGGIIHVHSPIQVPNITLGGNTASAFDTDTSLTADSNSNIATQHAIKTYADAHTGSAYAFSDPLVNNAGTVEVHNNATNTITAVSNDVTLAPGSNTLMATQHAIKTYIDNSPGIAHLISGTASFRSITATVPGPSVSTPYRMSKVRGAVIIEFPSAFTVVMDPLLQTLTLTAIIDIPAGFMTYLSRYDASVVMQLTGSPNGTFWGHCTVANITATQFRIDIKREPANFTLGSTSATCLPFVINVWGSD